MNYDEVYIRNIGLFNAEQQEKLKNSKVAIAGTGGVGGIQAVVLARCGIGELTIMDPGIFDEPDMNRQYGAMKSTIGRNKAVVTSEILKDINPFMKVNVYDRALQTEKELEEFMEGSELVVDAIEYMGFDYKAMFAEVARKKGLYNFTCPIPDFTAILITFDPDGMTLEDFYLAPSDRESQKTYVIPQKCFFGRNYISENLKAFIDKKQPYISTFSGPAALAGALLSTEIILMLTGLRNDEEIIKAPYVTCVNLLTRKFEIYNPHEG